MERILTETQRESIKEFIKRKFRGTFRIMNISTEILDVMNKRVFQLIENEEYNNKLNMFMKAEISRGMRAEIVIYRIYDKLFWTAIATLTTA